MIRSRLARRPLAARALGRILLAGGSAALPWVASSAAAAPAPAGSVVLLTGQGTAASPAGAIRPLAKAASVYSGDIVSTNVNSYLNLGFNDGGFVLLRPESRFHVRDYANASAPVESSATPKGGKGPARANAAASSTPTTYAAPGNPSCQAFAGQPLHVDGCSAGRSLVLPGVTFASGSAFVSARAQRTLVQLAAELRSHPQLIVEIGGFTDDRGPARANQSVSQARAAAVRRFLVAQGVAEGRLGAKGYGKEHPIADNGSDRGRETNRRVEVKVLSAAGVVAAPQVATTPVVPETPSAATTASSTPLIPVQAATPDNGGSHAFFSLLKGGFRAVSGAIGKINHDEYEIATPVATIGIRGTDFVAVLCDATCALDPVITPLVADGDAALGGLVAGDVSGAIVVRTAKGERVLAPGEYALVLADGTLIPLPSVPRFLAEDPTPDPRNCGA